MNQTDRFYNYKTFTFFILTEINDLSVKLLVKMPTAYGIDFS